MNETRRKLIASALAAELHRQAVPDLSRLDMDLLAGAVDDALEQSSNPPGEVQMRQAKPPSELNSANDA